MRKKIGFYKELGFDGVQFHDDDAAPKLNELTHNQTVKKAREVRQLLNNHSLVAKSVAPRL